MRTIAAYLLLVLGGNQSPEVADVSKLLDSVGIKIEENEVNALISSLRGKKIEELIRVGRDMLVGEAQPQNISDPPVNITYPEDTISISAPDLSSSSDGELVMNLFD